MRYYNSKIKFKKKAVIIDLEKDRGVLKSILDITIKYEWTSKSGIAETRFLVTLNEPLYSGLKEMHKKAPYVLPLLIKDLEKYKQKSNLEQKEFKLVQSAIEGLEKIVKGK